MPESQWFQFQVDLRIYHCAVFLKNRTLWEAPSLKWFMWEHQIMFGTYIWSICEGYLGISNAEAVNFAMRLCGFSCRPLGFAHSCSVHPAKQILTISAILANLFSCWGHLLYLAWPGLYSLVAIFICQSLMFPHHLWDRAWRTWRDCQICSQPMLGQGQRGGAILATYQGRI